MDYLEFRAAYELQHPASVPKMEIEMHEYPAWVRWAVLLTFIAAALVSGVHTVPTVWKGITPGEIITADVRNWAALASLVMVEFAILLSAYLMAKGQVLAYIVVTIASVVAVGANLYSVVNAFATNNEGGVILVAVIMGIGAPLIALFTGKMYVDIHRADRVQDARSKKAYKEACVQWDKEIERAYKAHQKASVLRPSQTDRREKVSVRSDNRQTDKRTLVEQWLKDHPDKRGMSVRDIQAEMGGVVGHDLIAKVKKSMNGHAHLKE